MRVILDSNVLISALISARSGPARLVGAWLEGEFTLVSHPLQLDELRHVTRRDGIARLIRPSEAGRLVNQIALLADLPSRLPPVRRSPDPGDDFLLALCEAGRADWLVTGDKRDLLALDRQCVTRIATVAAFEAALDPLRK